MTPFQKRMNESAARKSHILKLSRQKKPKLSQQQIADIVETSKAYVGQVLKAARAKA